MLERGFAATTVDAVLEATGTSKGAFFHHFSSKGELAHALVERYAAADLEHLDRFMAAAEATSADPAEQLVEFVALFEEAADEIAHVQSGCLYVSFVYERQLVDERTSATIVDVARAWRARLAEKIEAAIAVHPPPAPVDVTSLADLTFTTFEGGFVLARTFGDPSLLRGQLAHLRRYLELLFAVGTGVAPTPASGPTRRSSAR